MQRQIEVDVDRLVENFDHLDPGLTSEALSPLYRRMLAECPVGKSTAHGGFAFVSTYDGLVEVSRDSATFSSAEGVLHPVHSEKPPAIPIEFDPPLHTPYRRLFMEVLSAPRVRLIEPYLRDLTGRLLDSYAAGSDPDFVQQVAVQLPIRAVCHLLGFGEDSNDRFQAFGTRILETYGTPAMAEALSEMDALMASELEARRRQPKKDYVTTIVEADIDGRPLREDELLNILRTFVFAGFETTARASASIVHHLATHPALQDSMRADHQAIAGILEEGLRLHPPVQTMFRTVTTATSLQGVPLEPGDRIALLYGAANLDPTQFEDAGEFCPARSNVRQHLTFGIGRHYCAGAPLARTEMRLLLEALADRPPFELAGTPRFLPHLMMGQMMGVDFLPLRFKGDG